MSVEGSVERIISVLEERALGHDIDIVDVEVVGSAKAPVVRVRIDHADEDGKTISLMPLMRLMYFRGLLRWKYLRRGWTDLYVEFVISSAFPAVRFLCRPRLWRGVVGIPASF